jgi:hypothetical protein
MFFVHGIHKIYWNVGVWWLHFMTGVRREGGEDSSRVRKAMIGFAVFVLIAAMIATIIVASLKAAL